MNKLGLVNMETVRLVLNHSSTGVITLTVVNTLPLTELAGFLQFHHVLRVNGVPVSGKIIHLDENATCGPESPIKQKTQGS